MSYTRRYDEVVSKSVSVAYDYPASERGGTIRDVVSVDIPVTIDIDVDTTAFDHSVGAFKSNINLLQGTVTGAEAAHIAAKIQSANDIADSLVRGFYNLIQSEIGQQISEMMPKVQALTMELMQHQESCLSKKGQLGEDFNRILERYTRLFDDLDKELKSRILSLNHSANSVQGSVNQHLERYFKSPGVIVSTVHLKERQELTAKIVASGLKSRAVIFLSNAKSYLNGQKTLAIQMNDILEEENAKTSIKEKLPVLFMQSTAVGANVKTHLFLNEADPGLSKADLQARIDAIINQNEYWKTLGQAGQERISQLIYSEIVKYGNEKGKDQRSRRVTEKIQQLWNSNKESLINY